MSTRAGHVQTEPRHPPVRGYDFLASTTGGSLQFRLRVMVKAWGLGFGICVLNVSFEVWDTSFEYMAEAGQPQLGRAH